MIDIEFIYRDRGKPVLVEARVSVLAKCDCYSQAHLHPHVDRVEIVSLTDGDTGEFINLSPETVLGLESRAAEAALMEYEL